MSNHYSERLTNLINLARTDIEIALQHKVNPLMAYSGGKDGNVVMHLVNSMTKIKGVYEGSFYYEKQKNDVADEVQKLNYDVELKESLGWDYLSKHQDFIFTNDNKVRAKDFALRQQGTVKKYALNNNHDIVIFGRRTQENSVKAKLYEANGLLNFHPVRDWQHEDIWEYIHKTSELEVPWIYSQFHGKKSGNSAFHTLRAKYFAGGHDEAWAYCTSLDPKINREQLNAS